VILGLLNTFSYSMSYDQLRTKEQLGYTVGTLVRKFRGSQGFQILVQGDRHPAFVESRIDNFLEGLDVNWKIICIPLELHVYALLNTEILCNFTEIFQ